MTYAYYWRFVLNTLWNVLQVSLYDW